MYCGERKTFKTLLSFESVKLRSLQLTNSTVSVAVYWYVEHVQGEMDVDGGQPTIGLDVVAATVVVITLVVVVVTCPWAAPSKV